VMPIRRLEAMTGDHARPSADALMDSCQIAATATMAVHVWASSVYTLRLGHVVRVPKVA
jgi:hypothetical protein